MDGSWIEFETEILDCLGDNGAMTPAELGRRLGFSEGAAVSLLSILAREGKVRICLVEVRGDGGGRRRLGRARELAGRPRLEGKGALAIVGPTPG